MSPHPTPWRSFALGVSVVACACKPDVETEAPKTKQVDVAWMPGQSSEPEQTGPKCRNNGLDNRPGCGRSAASTEASQDAGEFEAEELKGQRRRRKARRERRKAVAPEQCPPELSRMQTAVIPAEAFVMGCDDPDRCGALERPATERIGKSFVIHTTEVTQGAYQRCIADGACTKPAVGFGPQAGFEPLEHCTMPVASVTWEQAQVYCQWAGMRLATEVEWEHAARGTDGRPYPWGDETPTCGHANFSDCGGKVHAVGSHPEGASPYGVHDMAGNVREWLFDREPSDASESSAWRRAIRGGMFTDAGHELRSSRRTYGDIEATDRGLGIRCVR